MMKRISHISHISLRILKKTIVHGEPLFMLFDRCYTLKLATKNLISD